MKTKWLYFFCSVLNLESEAVSILFKKQAKKPMHVKAEKSYSLICLSLCQFFVC